MSVSRINAWTLTNFSLPSGSAPPAAGNNRMHVVVLANENVGEQTVTTFTIGGQPASYERKFFLEAGSTDLTLYMFVWDEAAIVAMSGSSIVFAGISSGAQLSWAYCTLQADNPQAAPVFDDDGAQSSNSHALSTVSDTDDFLIGQSMDRSQNRRPLACDTMTERVEQSVSFYAFSVFDDSGQAAGASDISTFTNDGISGDFAAMAAVFSEGGVTKTAVVRLSDIDQVDRSSLTGLESAWYDAFPLQGVAPTDTQSGGTTDASGNFSMSIPNTTLNVGQTGYLVIEDAANGWQAIHAVVVS